MQHKNVKELLFDLSSDIEEVRKVAIIWLAQVGDEAVLPDLRRMTQDPSTSIRYFARRAIDTIEKRLRGGAASPTPAAAAPAARFQVEDWRQQLASDEVSGRLATAQALAKLDAGQARPLALERLPVESEPAVKTALIALLAIHRNEADLDLLFVQLADADPGVRAEAVLALEGFYHESIRDRLLPMVRDPDNRTRANVLLVLGRYDEDLIAGPLTEMASSREIWNKDSAVFVCKRLRTPRAVELLGRMYAENRNDGYLFPKVAEALQELAGKGDETARRVLASLEQGRFQQVEGRLELDRVLDDIESETDEEAREKRVKRSAVKTVAEFEAALADEDYERRLSAVDAGIALDPLAAAIAFRERLGIETHPFVISKLIKELGRVGGRADMELIASQLVHPDARVRANAIEGLALLGGEQIYERIKPLMDDPAPRVQGTATKVIYRIDRDRAFRKLKAMIVSSEGAVSDAAIHALGEVSTDDVLDLLELVLGQDNQELRLKIFKVLQRLSARSQVAAQIYARYREEGDGLLLKLGDLSTVAQSLRDTQVETRLKGVNVLRKSPDARAQMALEKLARDRDPAVRRASQVALKVRDLELERGVMLYHLGSALYRAWKRGELENPELDEAFKAVESEGQVLDQGGDPVEVLAKRGAAMAEAGRKCLALVNDFAIKHRARTPRPEDAKGELDVDGLPALAAKIETVNRKLEEREKAAGEEVAAAEAARPPSGPVTAPPPPEPIASGAITPKEGVNVSALPIQNTAAYPTMQPKRAGTVPGAGVSATLAMDVQSPGADAAPAGGPAPAATRAISGRVAKKPAAAAAEPAPESESSAALLRVWLQQNPALALIGGVLGAVMLLVVFASGLGGESFRGAWKRTVKEPANLIAAGDEVLALSSSGTLTSMSLASGKVEWQFGGPTFEAPFPPRADGERVFLSGGDGRIVAVALSSGRKLWEAKPGPMAAPPAPHSGRLVVLVKEPPSVLVLDAKSGHKLHSRTVDADVHTAVPILGGVLFVRKKGLSLNEPTLAKSLWEMVLPVETLPEVVPFEVNQQLILQVKDLLLSISKDGTKMWERRLEPNVVARPGIPGRKEIFVVGKKFVELMDHTGKGGATATIGRNWTSLEIGKGDVLFSDPEGAVYLLDMKDKTQRRLLDGGEPVKALVRKNEVGVAAVGGRVEAFSLQPPRS